MPGHRSIGAFNAAAGPPPTGWSEYGIVFRAAAATAPLDDVDAEMTENTWGFYSDANVYTNANGDACRAGYISLLPGAPFSGDGSRYSGAHYNATSPRLEMRVDLPAGDYDLVTSTTRGHVSGTDRSKFDLSVDGADPTPGNQWIASSDAYYANSRFDASGVPRIGEAAWLAVEGTVRMRILNVTQYVQFAIDTTTGFSWSAFASIRFYRV